MVARTGRFLSRKDWMFVYIGTVQLLFGQFIRFKSKRMSVMREENRLENLIGSFRIFPQLLLQDVKLAFESIEYIGSLNKNGNDQY